MTDNRPRLLLEYSDGTMQVVNYFTLPSFGAHLETFGAFQSGPAYYSKPDPFGRSPSVMPYDRELKVGTVAVVGVLINT
jgi:hypothetical protein